MTRMSKRRINKWIGLFLALILLLPVQSACAYAYQEVTVAIPVRVARTQGTVVIDAQEDAPSPAVSSLKLRDSAEEFRLSFTEPGDYQYRIWQEKGTQEWVSYDLKEYEIEVSVVSNAEEELIARVIVSDGTAYKPAEIVFENSTDPVSETTAETGKTTTGTGGGAPGTGDDTPVGGYALLLSAALLFLLLTLPRYFTRRKKV